MHSREERCCSRSSHSFLPYWHFGVSGTGEIPGEPAESQAGSKGVEPRASTLAVALASGLLACLFLGSVAAQNPSPATIPYSTHDWVDMGIIMEPPKLDEAWVDVKSPGDGRTYKVGTVMVLDTTTNPMFSGSPIGLPPLPALPFQTTLPGRQIVVVQACNATGSTGTTGNTIWQRYFYGWTAGFEETQGLATNARGISVWAASNPTDTRIAICGETYDEQIPMSQYAGPLPGGTYLPVNPQPNGFIAVYRGDGQLLWTYHFHGSSSDGASAITDVSVRNSTIDPGNVHVTYCGVSTHGVPASSTPLSPVRGFTAPPGFSPGYVPAAGNSNNISSPFSRWDGIVGRLSRPFAGTGTTTALFHSIVGGFEQDGLFGIAEITETRFVVVGSTAWNPVPAIAIGAGLAFPFSHNHPNTPAWYPTHPPVAFNNLTEYVLGVTAIFDASAVPQGNLALQTSSFVGSLPQEGTDPRTVARDVIVAPQCDDSNLTRITFVGSTNDAGFLTSLRSSTGAIPHLGFQQSLNGGTDGFIITTLDLVGGPVWIDHATYFGFANEDGLTGISAWSEYHDHFAVVGFSGHAELFHDFLVGSVFYPPNLANPPGWPFLPLALPRDAVVGGTAREIPAAMGVMHATQPGSFQYFGLGSPSGGGIAVDERARATIVGATQSTDYPVVSGRGFLIQQDAVHTRLDMVPAGVSRTDGTGTRFNGVTPPQPGVGINGGTTPTCGLAPFGLQVGLGPPEIRRMLVDYEGPAPAAGVNNAAVLLDHVQDTSTNVILVGLQVNFPSTAPTISSQVELWLSNPVIYGLYPPFGGSQFLWTSYRYPLGPMPSGNPGATVFSLQFVLLLNRTFCGAAQLSSVGSPALTIHY